MRAECTTLAGLTRLVERDQGIMGVSRAGKTRTTVTASNVSSRTLSIVSRYRHASVNSVTVFGTGAYSSLSSNTLFGIGVLCQREFQNSIGTGIPDRYSRVSPKTVQRDSL